MKLCLCRKKYDNTIYHLFESVSQRDETSLNDLKSRCAKINRLDTTCLKLDIDESEARTLIAKYVNNGYEICSICVSRLYENEH